MFVLDQVLLQRYGVRHVQELAKPALYDMVFARVKPSAYVVQSSAACSQCLAHKMRARRMHTDDALSAFATPEAKHDMNHAVVHAEFGAGRSFSVIQKERVEMQVAHVCADGLYARVSL